MHLTAEQASALERLARQRLQSLVRQDARRALFVAIVEAALTSVCRGAPDCASTLRWVHDVDDHRVSAFATIVSAIDEDPAAWRRVFSALPPRRRGRPLSAIVRDDIASEPDASSYLARAQIPAPAPQQLARIVGRRYGRRTAA